VDPTKRVSFLRAPELAQEGKVTRDSVCLAAIYVDPLEVRRNLDHSELKSITELKPISIARHLWQWPQAYFSSSSCWYRYVLEVYPFGLTVKLEQNSPVRTSHTVYLDAWRDIAQWSLDFGAHRPVIADFIEEGRMQAHG
jgi:hypothetical protein